MRLTERDPVSGYATTGHDWNGIIELNSPVPKVVWWFIAVTHLVALVAWVLLPTWPLLHTYTKGILGVDQRSSVTADLTAANAARAVWRDRIATLDFDAIRADPVLMGHALATAAPLFGQNCASCHGAEGRGNRGFPRLADGIWIWGGTPEEIAQTITVGVNSDHPETRSAQMPAFGRDGLLSRAEIATLTDYVQTLSGGVTPDDPSPGARLFQDNCAACHGADAKGIKDTGAQNLTDADWLYGGDAATIRQTLMNGRQGVMPSWAARLEPAEIKMLTLYVESLSQRGAKK